MTGSPAASVATGVLTGMTTGAGGVEEQAVSITATESKKRAWAFRRTLLSIERIHRPVQAANEQMPTGQRGSAAHFTRRIAPGRSSGGAIERVEKTIVGAEIDVSCRHEGRG